jgi:hypothetical protein
MQMRSFETSGQLTDRLSNVRIWRQDHRVVGLQIESESSTGKRWWPVVGKEEGQPTQLNYSNNETVVEVDGPLALGSRNETTGIRTLRFRTLPITRDGERRVLGDFKFYDTGEYSLPIDLDAAWVRSTTFFEPDHYPLSEIIGFWGHLDDAGRVCSLGVIRQQSPKHDPGFTPFGLGQVGSAGPVGEDPVENLLPGHAKPNRIGVSIHRIRSWVNPTNRRIVGLRFDWYGEGVAPMIIGAESGTLQQDWEAPYNAGIVRIFADFDSDGYLTKLDLIVAGMVKAGTPPSQGGFTGEVLCGIGSSTRRQGNVESVGIPTAPYGGPSFYDMVPKGEPGPNTGVRGFDVVTRLSYLYEQHF